MYFLILYIITGSLSNFGAIDILAPQWIYLGCVNILVSSYILFFASKDFKDSFGYLFSSCTYIYIYFILFGIFYPIFML